MSVRFVLLAGLLVAIASTANAAMCSGKPDPQAKSNVLSIDTSNPVFVKSVANGKLYTVGTGEDKINVVHVWGTPYQWGEAQGELLKDEAHEMLNRLWGYLEEQVEEGINATLRIPPDVQKLIADVGLDVALDLTYDATKKYSGDYFFEEMKGLADACGADFKMIRRIHMIGELTKGACSMVGAWGKATANGSTLQVRALDWDVEGPFKDYPQLTVYHVDPAANATLGHDFVNIGWTGWLGSITGMSSERLAISEIGVTFPDDTFGKESRVGTPFTFLLRDILQFDGTVDDSINRMANTKRTCNLILGVGDGKLETFRSVRYSGSNIAFYDDKNMEPSYDWHPRMDNIVYYGMDWLCPTYTSVLNGRLQANYGNLTAESMIHDVIAHTQTGNLHIAVYDLTNNVFYTSNARASYEKTGILEAYGRQYVRVDAGALYKEQRP